MKELEKYGEPDTTDIKAIEEQLIKEYGDNFDPVKAASTMYGLYMPKFKQGVGMLSTNALRRLINALIEYPLQEKKYAHSTPLEKQLMSVGHAVLEAKFLMILHTYTANMDALEEAANPDIEPNLTDEEKAELEVYKTEDK